MSLRSALFAALALIGCNNEPLGPSIACDGGADCPTACGPGVDNPPYEGHTHVPEGTTVNYIANAPTT